MENIDQSIVKKFQDLRMFRVCNYNYRRMDELVKDLTHALEETSHQAEPRSKSDDGGAGAAGTGKSLRKRRGRKRRTNTLTSSHLGTQATISEASQSSIEEALKDYMDSVVLHCSDSDDVMRRKSHMPDLGVPFSLLSLPESDSYPECAALRPPRRRRKLNRMAVEEPSISDVNMAEYKPRRKMIKSRHTPTKTGEPSTSDVLGVNFQELRQVTVSPNSLKRRLEARGEGQSSAKDLQTSKEMEEERDQSSSFSDLDDDEDEGFLTYDEAREGDDEQSDFFHEPGPACGIPGIVPWWETVTRDSKDKIFEDILSGSFDLLSTSSRRSFKSRLTHPGPIRERDIRRGRRRQKPKQPSQRAGGMSTAVDRFLWQDAQKQGLIHIPHPSTQTEVKRRKTATVSQESDQLDGQLAAHSCKPIPQDNIGSRMLQNMGWTPGTGLGATNDGIHTPVMAVTRPKRKGLGHTIGFQN